MATSRKTNWRRYLSALTVFGVVFITAGGLSGQTTNRLQESFNALSVQAQETTDDLAEKATWKNANVEQVKTEFEGWLKQIGAKQETADRISGLLNSQTEQENRVEMIDTVLSGIVFARPDVGKIFETLRGQRKGTRPPDFSSLLDNPEEADFLRDHVRLYYGRWLAQNEFYDESLAQFQQLKLEKVLDRSSLLFYRGLMEHQLLKKEECLNTINQLLENSKTLPKRYEVLSKLMLADIGPLKADSLDEISRMMNDIRRRTDLSRSGKIVLEREEEVIKKLDKLIEELESQQQAQQAASNTTPSQPMQDSFRAGGQGSGEVTSKRQNDGGDWGDLPPADRAAALAEMAKDMPPHYRAVIEEYFKQLAKQDEK